MLRRDPLFNLSASSTADRRARSRNIALEVLRQWDQGSFVDEEALSRTHAELMPELAEELRAARAIRAALLSSRLAGLADEAVSVLSAEELEKPISLSGPAGEREDLDALPHISGYPLTHIISRGGQATVYAGSQESTGRKVAVKVMLSGPEALSRHRARFDREAKLLASLNHCHIVGILERGRTRDGSFFLVMEYIDGVDLDVYLKQNPIMDRAGARRWIELFVKIVRAIDVAHRQGVIHRDLKPTNIRIDHSGEPKILDFGLARQILSTDLTVTVTGDLVGSVNWMSPEQTAAKEELTAQSDIYSLGVILYHALTRAFPYYVDGPLPQTLWNIVHMPAGPLLHGKPFELGRRDELDAIVRTALQKNPADRYASAGLLADDLERMLTGQRTAARPSKSRLPRPSIVLVCIMVTGLAGWRYEQRPRPPQVFELPSITNSIGIRLVRLPSGPVYANRLDFKQSGHSTVEVMHPVQMEAFYIATTEVTQRQYEDVVGSNPSTAPWRGPDLPVQNVSWKDAMKFCELLSAKEHHHYRLPTNLEWNFACRVGDSEPANIKDLEPIGWSADNSGRVLHPVAQKWPNSWGLYDMHGGVAELCDDQPISIMDTKNLSNRAIRPTLPVFTALGGSFLIAPKFCQADSGQYIQGLQTKHPDVGFRIVMDLEAK